MKHLIVFAFIFSIVVPNAIAGGYVSTSTNPEGMGDYGAKWKLDDSTWKIFDGIPVEASDGDHIVVCKSIPDPQNPNRGYCTAESYPVFVIDGRTARAECDYRCPEFNP